jgi:hypothetical protein
LRRNERKFSGIGAFVPLIASVFTLVYLKSSLTGDAEVALPHYKSPAPRLSA